MPLVSRKIAEGTSEGVESQTVLHKLTYETKR